MGTSHSGTEHRITQICIVVRDIDRSMREYTERLGWGPWNVYEHTPPTLHDTYLRDQATEYSMLGAETTVGGIGFELIQPVSGNTIYQEFLDRHGEGVQHIAIMKPTHEESETLASDVGVDKLMGGRIGESIEFYYLDSQEALGVTIEGGTGHAIDLKPVRTYTGD